MTTPLTQPATTAASLEDRVLVDRASAIQANLVMLNLGDLVNFLVVAAVLQTAVSRVVVGSWLAVQVARVALGLWQARRLRGRPLNTRNAARRLQGFANGALAGGLFWAAGIVFLWPPDRPELQLFLLLLAAGEISGALHGCVAHPPAFIRFAGPMTLASIAMLIYEGGTLNLALAAAIAGYAVFNLRLSQSLSRAFMASMRTRHEAADLAADLAVQKARAEEANLAKSRFLAAASHDLRQPVHALTLFVGALERRELDAETRRLVAHARGATDAMGGMFNALLDMSRLDAGMVRPELQAFDLKPLLARIAADEGALAQAKGLALRLNAQPLAVMSDPVQMQRIVANLVANAVRYTDRGGVLISARRHGQEAVIRVVDTGIGIAPERQAEVFREFVQLHNPERDRNQGLGLGLAIVRRLTDLLGVPLQLRSRPGRGTAFTLRLPLARALAAPAPAPATQPDEAALAPGLLVLVIDDDAEIRAAMQSLLAGWGCEVVAAGGSADLLPQLVALASMPHLLISDFRLRGEESGLAVIECVRTEYNHDIPAIVITGDTAPAHQRELAQCGHALLHKPVAPQALREAMARVLASAPAAA